ncbi:MAG: Ldh family oxidoreductase [Candidatus Omnitrophica bacterium]|nr:Ldh family oxidoreductase [Candidatus Omnitrophota bacterium]
MPQIETESVRYPYQPLRVFCVDLLSAAGLRSEDAELVSAALVETNLRGIDSHGVARLPHYLRRIRGGSIDPKPDMKLERLGPSLGCLDGGHGLGHVVMDRATKEVIDIAKGSGSGWVSVRNSSHCGALFYFGLQIAQAGMIGFVFTHVDPMVLPYGAIEPFCGTNPICITAPGEDGQSLCLDMATSVTPWNTIENAALEGKEIPLGWAVDSEGTDTTDPKEVAALYPVGGYKGSGLGLMIDVLCSLLSDSPYGPDIPKMYGDMTENRQLGGLVGAIDIERFVELKTFRPRIASIMQRWGNLKPSDPAQRPLYPGEPEMLNREERLKTGIPLGHRLIEQFQELANEYGIRQLNSHR